MKVIASHVLQLLPLMVPFCKVRQPSDPGVGRSGNVANVMIDLKDEIHLVFTGELSSGDLHGFL